MEILDNTLKTIKAVWLLNFMSKVYVDSNVFIAVILGDFGKSFEFMEYRSQEFFDKVLACHYEIVVSDAVIDEIKDITSLSNQGVANLLRPFANKLTIIKPDQNLLAEAIALNQDKHVGFNDCIHYLISKDYDCIVTWNVRHFPNGKKPSEM